MWRTISGIFLAVLAGVAPHPAAAWTVISHTVGGSAAPNGFDFTTPAINTTGADLIVVVTSSWAQRSFPALSDSAGNTFTLATSLNVVGAIGAGQIFYVQSPTTSSSDTFTISEPGVNFFGSAEVLALSGSTASPLDQTNNASETTNATSLQTGSITPTQNNELIIAGLAMGDNSSAYTVDSSLTISDSFNWVSSGGEGSALGYLAQGTAAAINPTFSWTGGSTGVAMIASFKAATSSCPHGLLLLGAGC